jgi:hypothetical protein
MNRQKRWLWIGVGVLSTGAVVLGLDSARAAAPAGRYVLTNTTVHDRRTKLTWHRQAAVGRVTWEVAKSTCEGSLADGGRWRLPTLLELQSLVDVRAATPAIDATAFPETPIEYFWTQTAYAGATDHYWAVNFDSGGAVGMTLSSPDGGPSTLAVRCVRED